MPCVCIYPFAENYNVTARVGLDAERGEGGGGLAAINLTHEFCCQRYFQLPIEVKTLAITLFNILCCELDSHNYVLFPTLTWDRNPTVSCTANFTISAVDHSWQGKLITCAKTDQ